MRYLLLLLYTAPVWGGSITLFAPVTSSCIVTTLPTNATVANDCNSTPGISATLVNSGFSIEAEWGEDLFTVSYGASVGASVFNRGADPSLIATDSLSGHLEYNQNFIITGGSGVGFISSSLPPSNDFDSGVGLTCYGNISTGETSPTGATQFTFGVPFNLDVFLGINFQLIAPPLVNPSDGGGCSNGNGINITDSQGQRLSGFDIEPTNLPVPEMPEPRTWLLVSAGLFGCWLMRSRAS